MYMGISLDDLNIHLGSSELINQQLRAEAKTINPEHVNVKIIKHSAKVLPSGMREMCGCFIEFNGEEVAKGCKEAQEWLNTFHRRRAAILCLVGQQGSAVIGLAAAGAH